MLQQERLKSTLGSPATFLGPWGRQLPQEQTLFLRVRCGKPCTKAEVPVNQEGVQAAAHEQLKRNGRFIFGVC